MLIIDKDTTWAGTVFLHEKVQVAEGATLTLAAGTRILGDPNESPAAIEVFGGLRTSPGSEASVLANVRISLQGNTEAASTTNIVALSNAVLYRSALSNENEFGGALSIVDAQLHYTAIESWYLDTTLVDHSVLVDSPLSVGVDARHGATAEVRDSLLIQASAGATPLTVYASYGGPVTLQGSTVLVENRAAIRLTSDGGIDGAGVKGSNNYLYSPSVSAANLVLDHNDDLQAQGVVQLIGALSSPSRTAPNPSEVLSIDELGHLLPWGPNTLKTTGTDRNDTFEPKEADAEIIDGKGGTDLFIRGLMSSTVTITGNAHERHVYYTTNLYNHPVTLIDVERIQFIDHSLAFDLDGDAGFVARVICAVFGAAVVSNQTYVGIGLRELDAGTSHAGLAQLAASAAGLTAPEALVRTLWKNVIGTEPSTVDVQPYLDLMVSGMSPGELVTLAAQSTFAADAVGLVGLAETGLAYV